VGEEVRSEQAINLLLTTFAQVVQIDSQQLEP
jgi:hypothetical protein